eukprot:98341_1
MNYTELQNDDITIIKEEIEELKQWKEEIGIPTQHKNEELSNCNEQLNEEIKTLKLELEEYNIEINKLKTDKNDLSEELHSLSITNMGIEQQQNSLKHQDEVLQTLQQYYEESQSQFKRDSDRIKELCRENKQLKEENQQYEIILENIQREEASLKDKIHKESQQLRELKAKYEQLDLEYHAEKSFAKHTSVVAQELQQEVADLKNSYQHTLETINDNDNSGGAHAARKTLKFGPQTLRLARVDSDTFAKMFDMDSPIAQARNSFAYKRLSQIDALHMQYVQYDSTDRTNVLSDDEQNNDMKNAKDYGYDDAINKVKQQLQIEYDDKLGKEKGKLIKKHKLEINDLNKQIIKYKKQIMDKNTEINRLKTQ